MKTECTGSLGGSLSELGDGRETWMDRKNSVCITVAFGSPTRRSISHEGGQERMGQAVDKITMI